MSSLIEHHYKRALAFLGFGNCEKVYWTLGWCQGDGMAFEARIEGDGLKKIIQDRFYSKDGRYFEKYVDQGLAFNLTHSGRYTHSNSMSCEVDWDVLRDFETDLKPHLYAKLEARAIELRDEIDEYVKEVSRALEADGYAILEATPCESDPDVVREFRTRRFTVRVSKLHDSYPNLLSEDEDSEWAQIQDIICGKLTYYNLQVEVLDEDETVIGEATLLGMLANPQKEGRFFHGELRSLVREAIAQAREKLPGANDQTVTAKAA